MDEPIRDLGHKSYLGDGAYVDFDGFALHLTTENGIVTTNRVVLEPEVWTALQRYMSELRGDEAEGKEADRG